MQGFAYESFDPWRCKDFLCHPLYKPQTLVCGMLGVEPATSISTHWTYSVNSRIVVIPFSYKGQRRAYHYALTHAKG